MRYSFVLILVLILFPSCQKKKSAEPSVQRVDNYVPPASEAEIDLTQSYLSPSDAFSDGSAFYATNFQPNQIKYRGTRKLFYHISKPLNSDLTVVTEYLSGAWTNGDTLSTATRILLYADDILLYRKAFPIEFSGAVNFSSVRKFNHTVLPVRADRSILYYWFDKVDAAGSVEKEYHAVAVDQSGITNELSGDLTRIGDHYNTVRFLNDSRLKARIPPNRRYPYLSVDVIYTVDWQTCSATMEVPVDTIFTVSEQPSRFFSSKLKLSAQPEPSAAFKETNFRRLTQAQMQRIFIPSLFDSGSISRDHLFIQFNRTTSGWIDHETMKFEEIVSEN